MLIFVYIFWFVLFSAFYLLLKYTFFINLISIVEVYKQHPYAIRIVVIFISLFVASPCFVKLSVRSMKPSARHSQVEWRELHNANFTRNRIVMFPKFPLTRLICCDHEQTVYCGQVQHCLSAIRMLNWILQYFGIDKKIISDLAIQPLKRRN